MLVKAFRTRDLESYSLGNLLIANVGNGVHSIYVFSLPIGPDLVPARLLRRLDRGDAALAPAVRRAASEGGEASGRAARERPRLSGMTDAFISSAYSQTLEVIASVEPRIAEATRQELADQRGSLKLIASENYASPAVLLTMGTWFSDKYAEGTIGHRFYAGCQNVDTVESIAAEHARELFGAPYAYVQPHSGIDANLVGVLVDPRPPRRDAGPREARCEERQRAVRGRTGSRCGTSSATSGCSACHSTPAATSPTASAPTSAARCSTSSSTAPTRRPGCSTTTRSPRRPASSSRWCSSPATRRTRAG